MAKYKGETEAHIDYLGRLFHLPTEILAGNAYIRTIGNSAMIIENYQHIIEYTDQQIKIKTKYFYLIISGMHLIIQRYDDMNMEITGFIKAVTYQLI